MDAIASPQTLEEFTDVISRPLFSLESSAQERILDQWRALARVIDDVNLSKAPWQCVDPDDQVFLNLAYSARPCLLMSKDNEVLKLANRAAADDVLISSDYNAIFN